MRLREARRNAGYTQKFVADYMGIGQNTYSYWESGKTKLDGNSLVKLAELFNVSVEYLLDTPPAPQTTPKLPADFDAAVIEKVITTVVEKMSQSKEENPVDYSLIIKFKSTLAESDEETKEFIRQYLSTTKETKKALAQIIALMPRENELERSQITRTSDII